MAELSEYEKQRLARMSENQEMLISMGLGEERDHISQASHLAKSEKEARAKRMPPPPPTRVSARARKEVARYTGWEIDHFGEEYDAAAARRDRGVKRPLSDQLFVDDERAAAMADAVKRVEEIRESLRAEEAQSGSLQRDKWKAHAIAKWGPCISKASEEGWDWEKYVLSRRATPSPTSPNLLLQEYYAAEPWKLLIACALMSRVSSHETKTRCIEGFFSAFPTPSSLFGASPQDVESIIKPLGLFDSRYRTVLAISDKWLNLPEFEIGLDTNSKIYGCGAFTVDSFNIFCRDDRSVVPSDAALRGYVEWRKKASDCPHEDDVSVSFAKKKTSTPVVKADEDADLTPRSVPTRSRKVKTSPAKQEHVNKKAGALKSKNTF